MDCVVNKSKMEIMVRDFSVLSTVDVSFYPGWIAYTPGFQQIWQMDFDGNWVQIADVADGSVTEYKVTGLASATEYQFRVRSYNMDGETALYSEYKTVSGVTL